MITEMFCRACYVPQQLKRDGGDNPFPGLFLKTTDGRASETSLSFYYQFVALNGTSVITRLLCERSLFILCELTKAESLEQANIQSDSESSGDRGLQRSSQSGAPQDHSCANYQA